MAMTVAHRAEGEAIRAGLEDETVRAYANIMGVLRQLSTDGVRGRVMQFVNDSLGDATGNGKDAQR